MSTPNIGLQRTARLRLAAAEAGAFGVARRVLILLSLLAGGLAWAQTPANVTIDSYGIYRPLNRPGISGDSVT